MTSLRVGRIAALNMYPLYHWLERAEAPLRFRDGHPTELNAAVIAGGLDASAMSSIAYARHSDRLRLLPVASITAAGAVDSIQLFSKVPLEQVRRVAVTPHSATSVVMLRILVGPDVTFQRLSRSPREALVDSDGVLLIGDEALVGLRQPFAPHHRDVAELWHEREGRPMVFAVWAVRTEVAEGQPEAVEQLAELLRAARARYAADPEAVVRAAARRFPFPPDFIRRYFRRLSYDFGEAELAGLERFLARARDIGELETVPRLAA